MKLKKWKSINTIGAIALAGIVIAPTLILTSCSGGSSTPTSTKINIYGTTDIHGSLQDSAQLNAVDNIGNDVTQGSWTISETIPGFSFSNTQPGKLMWDVDAPGTYRLSIQVTAEGLTATKENIAIVVSNDAPAPATTFTIYGESTINGVAGLSSTSSYSAVDNTGNDVTNNSTWSLIGAPSGVSINSGTLNWTSSLSANTYTFAIHCVSGTLTGQDKSVTLTITTPKPAATSINVYGAPAINGNAGTAGSMQYTAINNNGEALTNPTWSITSPPAGVTINNSGLLSWTASATAGTFTINCAAAGLTSGTLSVTLNITIPKPTPTSINVYGAPTINGVAGTAGSMQYTATNNNGESLTSPVWTLTSTPAGVSINNSGLLSWTASAAAGTFTISCAASGLTTGTLSVTLNITTPKPAATSINVYGAPTINGVAGTAGSMQYTATDNNGESLTSPTWSITTLAGVSINNSGVLSWADNATAGAFTISCAASGLTTGTLQVTLTITTPKPTPTSINVYGAPTINGVPGTAGNMQYTATNNNGESLTSPTWSITTLAGVSISNSGVLSWADNATTGTFTISCAADGLTTGTLQVTLNIIPPPTPTPSKPIPFTDEYFEWTTSTDELTITGLQGGVDLSNYDTLSIPATYTDGSGDTYFITAIGANAFRELFNYYSAYDTITNLDLTTAVNLNSIGTYAFENCSGFTGSLIIPGSVTNIYEGAFMGCSGFSGSLIIPNSVTIIHAYTFFSCSGFTGSLVIPNSVSSIAATAFLGCSGLTGSLTIPDSVISIGNNAFDSCGGFTGSLTIPNSVTDIGVNAFYGCSGFTGTLTIGNSVTNIGQFAFATIKFTDVINYSPSFNLADNVGNAKVLIPASSGTSLDYESGSVVGCIAFGQLTIPDSVTSIHEYLFSHCSGLTGSLIIPNSVTDIGDGAFTGCSGFTGSLIIPNSVTSISGYAFESCSGFTGSLTIPNSVTSIGDGAFYQCSGFTGSLTIPNLVTDIGDSAFYACWGFTGSLTIGNSVTDIGDIAFYACWGFNTINVSSWTSVPTIGNDAFIGFNNTDGGTVIVPAGLGITISTFKGLPDIWQLSPV